MGDHGCFRYMHGCEFPPNLSDHNSPWLFISFGLLFSIPFLIGALKLAAKKWPFFKSAERTILGHSEPKTTFVPHWFMMAAIILTGILILAAILIPIFFK
ncbi:MAG: hypothetical protein FJ130_01150 [Deltaproteobacteria bacterium]|nr:hypothetical protein [Deltaproteobacteria bacterium]